MHASEAVHSHVYGLQYSASDAFTFVREINQMPVTGKFMVAFDVQP